MYLAKLILLSFLLWIIYSILSLREFPFYLFPLVLIAVGYIFQKLDRSLNRRKAIIIVILMLVMDSVFAGILINSADFVLRTFVHHLTIPLLTLRSYILGFGTLSDFLIITVIFYSPFVLLIGVVLAIRTSKK